MAIPPASRGGRDVWRKTREQGLQRYILLGALRRGIPMSLITIGALELFESGGFTNARLTSPEFAERVLFVFAVFLAGGALSAFARWKAYESLYGDDTST